MPQKRKVVNNSENLSERAYKGPVSRRFVETVDTLICGFPNCEQKILNSKALRALEEKAQVFIQPYNQFVRDRNIHTREVHALAMSMGLQLGLNVSLLAPMADAHDCGHVPYGHLGETIMSCKMNGISPREENLNSYGELGVRWKLTSELDNLLKKKNTEKIIRHENLAVFILEEVERKANGANISKEVLKGVQIHSRGRGSLTTSKDVPEEYNLLMWADKIAYVTGDINDAFRFNYFNKDFFPEEIKALGQDQRSRVKNLQEVLVKASLDLGHIPDMDEILKSGGEYVGVFENFRKTKDILFSNVYEKCDPPVYISYLENTYDYIAKCKIFEEYHPALVLSLMTDKDLTRFSQEILTRNMKEEINLKRLIREGFTFAERIQDLEKGKKGEEATYQPEKKMDYTKWENFLKPNLDWKPAQAEYQIPGGWEIYTTN